MQTVIYHRNKPIFLCNELNERLEKLHHRPDTVFIDELNSHTVKAMLHEIGLPEIKCGVFLHPDLAELKKQFFKKFEVHPAGGGLVLNKNQDILLIFRRGYWDLPKGHQDPGETIEACALREVQEETGLQNLLLGAPLTITYHSYEQGSHLILKESHWYLMQLAGDETPVPQTEEDIEQTKWVAPQDMAPYLEAAYPSIRDVITGYLHQLGA